MKTINIFNFDIMNISMTDSIKLICEKVVNKEKAIFYFVNADCVNVMTKDNVYYNYIKHSKYVFGDGSGIRIAAKFVGSPIIENINGTDLFPLLCETIENKEISIYLLGARPGVVDLVEKNMISMYPNLKIAGKTHGYFENEDESLKIVQNINKSGADILLVALGVPFQEHWINDNIKILNTYVNIGVGGLFDFYSGNMPRAPMFMRKIGLEWVFRLIMEPKRMAKRYIIGNPVYLIRLLRWKISNH